METIYRTIRLLVLTVLFAFIAREMKAQFISYGGGVDLTNGTTIETEKEDYLTSSLGFDFRAQYKINYNLRLVPELTFFLPKKEEKSQGEAKTTFMNLTLNLKNVHKPRDMIRTYLQGGISVSGWNIQDNYYSETQQKEISLTEWGVDPAVNAGAGIQFNIKRDIEMYLEARYMKYVLNEYGLFIGSLGVNIILD
jgi:hypothetical protein